MLTVYKYLLQPPVTTHLMPVDAKVLSVEWNPDSQDAFLYALVDTDYRKESRHFLTVGTGHDVNEFLDEGSELGPFVGTFSIPDMGFYFHVFEFLPFVP